MRAVVRLPPKFSRGYVSLGAAFEKTIKLKSYHADAHYDLGVAIGMLGDVDGAVAESKTTLRIAPQHVNALRNLARIRNSPPPQRNDR